MDGSGCAFDKKPVLYNLSPVAWSRVLIFLLTLLIALLLHFASCVKYCDWVITTTVGTDLFGEGFRPSSLFVSHNAQAYD